MNKLKQIHKEIADYKMKNPQATRKDMSEIFKLKSESISWILNREHVKAYMARERGGEEVSVQGEARKRVQEMFAILDGLAKSAKDEDVRRRAAVDIIKLSGEDREEIKKVVGKRTKADDIMADYDRITEESVNKKKDTTELQ